MSDITLSQLVRPRPQLTLFAARQMVKHALVTAVKQQQSVSVAVVDIHGGLIAFARDDNASGVTINATIEQARAAVQLGSPSRVLASGCHRDRPHFPPTPDVSSLQGGVAVVIDGQSVGAVGVSGARDGDTELATSAAMLFS
ncbi:heme-binding protein [Kluyvera genomosp. 2]|uniref:GlcG/HbpS family heme-binding protein n=1 Tax=Kluyvera genomosp. 2 TaxID=2774054 RepID=UPI002FD80EAF